jgi:hypothetical protein
MLVGLVTAGSPAAVAGHACRQPLDLPLAMSDLPACLPGKQLPPALPAALTHLILTYPFQEDGQPLGYLNLTRPLTPGMDTRPQLHGQSCNAMLLAGQVLTGLAGHCLTVPSMPRLLLHLCTLRTCLPHSTRFWTAHCCIRTKSMWPMSYIYLQQEAND